jgi:hypothetical protein
MPSPRTVEVAPADIWPADGDCLTGGRVLEATRGRGTLSRRPIETACVCSASAPIARAQ